MNIYIYFTIFLDYREFFDNSRNLISILQQVCHVSCTSFSKLWTNYLFVIFFPTNETICSL